jgi:Recombinase
MFAFGASRSTSGVGTFATCRVSDAVRSQSRLRLPTKKVRALALDAIDKRVASRAADLAPTIKQLQAAGNTTLRALAAGLNRMGITTARGGNWDQTQVRRLLARI